MALCGTSTLLLAAHWLLAVHLLKVPAVNGTVLAVTIFSQIQVVLSCVLLAATIFWTCIKIAKAVPHSVTVLTSVSHSAIINPSSPIVLEGGSSG